MADTPEVGPVLVSITRDPSYPNGVRPASRPKGGVATLKKFMSLRGAKDLIFHGDKDDKEKEKDEGASTDATAASGQNSATPAAGTGKEGSTEATPAAGESTEQSRSDDGSGFYRALIRTKVVRRSCVFEEGRKKLIC